jgi:hypothetical protein
MKTNPDPPEADAHSVSESDTQFVSDGDPRYRRAARLLAQKLGVGRRDLPREQVLEYLRKIEIARQKPPGNTDG